MFLVTLNSGSRLVFSDLVCSSDRYVLDGLAYDLASVTSVQCLDVCPTSYPERLLTVYIDGVEYMVTSNGNYVRSAQCFVKLKATESNFCIRWTLQDIYRLTFG